MTRIVRAKQKSGRRLRVNLWSQPKSASLRRPFPPGQHGHKPSSKLSAYAERLHAVQKLRKYYNITEGQIRNTFAEAARRSGDSGDNLIGLLESRLDAAVYNLGFAKTIFQARQMISHGHIYVNGKRVNIRSTILKVGDVVELSPSRKEAMRAQGGVNKDADVPDYLAFDPSKMTGSMARIPCCAEVPHILNINVKLNYVIEYFTR